VQKLVESQDLRTNFYTFEGVVKALNGVSVTVEKGETYGLVGESGCGKSVTVRSMMRIVQEPGRIEDGRILLFLGDENRRKGVDILRRSEAYMRSIRGDDISMIFQEASTSLNPVLSIGYQVGESFLFHRRRELLERSLEILQNRLSTSRSPVVKLWALLQRGLFGMELRVLRRYDEAVADIDSRLLELEGEESPIAKREWMNLSRVRQRIRRFHPFAQIVKRVPLLRGYYKLVRSVARQYSIDLLQSLGVPNPPNVVDRYPHELSGGMQQRIVIAIALACSPMLLIADEPTSNLDVTIQAQIVELIKELKQHAIASVLFITHDLGLVAEVCDRVTVMYAGDTCETAPVKELFQRPLHPYTQGLLSSVPKVEQEGELSTIAGTVPNLIDPPTGCRFHPRCPHAMDICRREKPPVTEYLPGHQVSCHLFSSKEASG
jgi:peptide/nickel transport system ATP-binding protein